MDDFELAIYQALNILGLGDSPVSLDPGFAFEREEARFELRRAVGVYPALPGNEVEVSEKETEKGWRVTVTHTPTQISHWSESYDKSLRHSMLGLAQEGLRRVVWDRVIDSCSSTENGLSFLDQVICGLKSPKDIDDEVEHWQAFSKDQSLEGFLGMSSDQLKLWLANPESLNQIINEQRRRALDTLSEAISTEAPHE
jgi:hypothetical protein